MILRYEEKVYARMILAFDVWKILQSRMMV